MKRQNKVFFELKKDLKKIRSNIRMSDYERWNKSKHIIDQFYDKNSVDLESLYNRLLGLKKRKERNLVITIPVFISIVFGVFVTWGFDFIKNFLDMCKNFVAQMGEKLVLAIQKYGEDQTLVDMHDEVVKTTLEELSEIFIVLILLLMALAFLITRLLYFYHDFKFLYFEVCNYEINRIERMLDKKQETESMETKAFLNLENNKYILKYELVNVTKK